MRLGAEAAIGVDESLVSLHFHPVPGPAGQTMGWLAGLGRAARIKWIS